MKVCSKGQSRPRSSVQRNARSGKSLTAVLPPDAMEHQPRRAASIAATSIFFMSIIASNARLA
jgi:hypothetical protein